MTAKPLSDRYLTILNKLYGYDKDIEHLKFIPSVSFSNDLIEFPIDRAPLCIDDIIMIDEIEEQEGQEEQEEQEEQVSEGFDFKAFIDSFSLEKNNDVIKFFKEGEEYYLSRVFNENVRNQQTDNIYHLNSNGNKVSYFSATNTNIYFDSHIWLLALFLLEQDTDIPTLDMNSGWPAIYERIGPFLISNVSNFSDCDLYRYGIFTSRPLGDEVVQHQWKDVEHGVDLSSPKPDIPIEAINAYKEALRISTTVDLSYINLFKVIEVLYAWGLKHQVNLITLDNIYNALREGSVTSEISMVKYIRQASGVTSLSHFTRADFKKLFPQFDSNRPKNYKVLKRWLDTANFNVVAVNSGKDDIKDFDYISEIFYYIRCALVHSKLDATGHSIRAPYSKDMYIALNKMVCELRHVIDRIMY